MKKILLLLCTLLGSVGAMATDVVISDRTNTVTTDAVTSTNVHKYGTYSNAAGGTTFTTNATSGMAGVTVTADGEFVRAAFFSNTTYLYTIAFNPADVDEHTITISAPDGYIVYGYSITAISTSSRRTFTVTPTGDDKTSNNVSAPGTTIFNKSGLSNQSATLTIQAATDATGNFLCFPLFSVTVVPEGTKMVNVTYELYDGDGETPVDTYVDESVEANSELNIPASWLNYVFFSNISSEGTIGDENCTIKVTRTNPRVTVTDLANLSNNKAYYIRNARGTWAIANSQMSASNTGDYTVSEAKQFVLYKTGEAYYLFSVSDSKFVRSDKSLSRTPEAITIENKGNATYPWYFKFNDSKIFNGGDGFMLIDGWNTVDAGNQNAIIEATDFDASVIDALLSIEGEFTTAIEQLRAINFGTGLNQYSFTGDYAAYTATASEYITTLEGRGASEGNLAIAQDMLAHYAINVPAPGFYRIKGDTSKKYLAAGLANNNKFAMTDATDATTIFYFDGSKLTNFGSGMCNGMTSGAWSWVTENNASTVEFQDGLTNGGYGIKSATCNFYDNGDGTASADRGNNVTISTSTDARYTNWYLEEITTLPVTISAADYATLCAPVALTIPDGVTAYTGTITQNHKYLTLAPLREEIPANTAVVLKGNEGSYDFAVTTAGAFKGTNDLHGIVAAIAVEDGSGILTLQNIDKVGFYSYSNTEKTLAGFKAYLTLPAGVKSLAIQFSDATAIQSINAAENGAAIYNLAGQRVSNAQKGIFIVGGKKIVK